MGFVKANQNRSKNTKIKKQINSIYILMNSIVWLFCDPKINKIQKVKHESLLYLHIVSTVAGELQPQD